MFQVTGEDLKKGTLEKVFIDPEQTLRLAPEYKELTTFEDMEAAVIWDAVSWKPSANARAELWLGGGTKGLLTALDTQLKPVFTTNLPYPEVTALATSTLPARLFVANGPNGALYQLTPRSTTETGAVPYNLTRLAAFPEPFIWDLYFHSPTQTLYVATGGAKEGAVYELVLGESEESTEKPTPTKLFSVSEANAFKLMTYEDYLLVSSSPRGKLYSYHRTEKTRQILYDSFQGDIADFTLAPETHKLYLATTSSSGSSPLPPNPQAAVPCTAKSTRSSSQYPQGRGVSAPCPEVSELYVLTLKEDPEYKRLGSIIRKLHTVEEGTTSKLMLQDLPKRLVYGAIENSAIRVLNLETLESELLHKQKNVSLAEMVHFQEEIYFISLEPSAIYKLGSSYSRTGSFTSQVIPLKETVQWGRFAWEDYSTAKDVSVETRTGNSQNPPSNSPSNPPSNPPSKSQQGKQQEKKLDTGALEHWSSWEPLTRDGKIASPPGSFMQFRLTLKPTNNASPRIQNIRFFFTTFNTAPELSPLQINYKPSENHPPQRSPQYRGNTPSTPLDFLKELNDFTRQYILSWKVLKNDADILRYTLAIRPLSTTGGTLQKTQANWRILAKDFFTNFFLIDNRKFPDGKYQLKLTYDDFLSNGREQGFVREKLSPYHIIDNTPPEIVEIDRSRENLTFTVKDNLSIVSRVFYSFDRTHHYELSPEDGVNDSLTETFSLPLPRAKESDQLTTFLIIAVDAAGNTSFVYP